MINTRMCDRQMDDSGSNVLIEYIFMILIMASFFTVFLLTLSNVLDTANQVVIGQELSVVSNDLANRIVAFSGKISIDQYNNAHWVSNVSSNTEEIDLPDMVEGKPYQVEVEYDESILTGAVKVTYGDDHSINSTAYFRSGIKVIPSVVSSTGYNPRIYYDETQCAIILVDN